MKANPAPEIVRTLYKAGASFDVASLPEFMLVYENIRAPAGQGAAGFHLGQDHLRQPDQAEGDAARRWTSTSRWSPTTTSTSCARSSDYAPHAGPGPAAARAQHRLDGGTVVQVRLRPGRGGGPDRRGASAIGPGGRGPELPRRQPVHQLRELRAGAEHGGGGDARGARRAATRSRSSTSAAASPRPTTGTSSRSARSRSKINAEIDRLFPTDIEILAEPGRFLVATAATSVATVIGKAVRDGKTCYYIDDSVYHTFSGIIFDHCQYHLKAFKKGKTEICAVFGQTCDGLDTISQSEELPDLEIDDLVYSGEHRRLQQRLGHLVQRLPAGQGRARQPVAERLRGAPRRRRPGKCHPRKGAPRTVEAGAGDDGVSSECTRVRRRRDTRPLRPGACQRTARTIAASRRRRRSNAARSRRLAHAPLRGPIVPKLIGMRSPTRRVSSRSKRSVRPSPRTRPAGQPPRAPAPPQARCRSRSTSGVRGSAGSRGGTCPARPRGVEGQRRAPASPLRRPLTVALVREEVANRDRRKGRKQPCHERASPT